MVLRGEDCDVGLVGIDSVEKENCDVGVGVGVVGIDGVERVDCGVGVGADVVGIDGVEREGLWCRCWCWCCKD